MRPVVSCWPRGGRFQGRREASTIPRTYPIENFDSQPTVRVGGGRRRRDRPMASGDRTIDAAGNGTSWRAAGWPRSLD